MTTTWQDQMEGMVAKMGELLEKRREYADSNMASADLNWPLLHLAKALVATCEAATECAMVTGEQL